MKSAQGKPDKNDADQHPEPKLPFFHRSRLYQMSERMKKEGGRVLKSFGYNDLTLDYYKRISHEKLLDK
jgi:hypothetical protein